MQQDAWFIIYISSLSLSNFGVFSLNIKFFKKFSVIIWKILLLNVKFYDRIYIVYLICYLFYRTISYVIF